ncbi:MAG: winged helix-turn-helix domain-containing protein [Acidobacteriota bacterium]|nr:winged helix-turn-helix domain-containing protein [Acidobacteriota bacterium]
MSIPEGYKGLYFPCDCVSARKENYSDPWAGVAKNRLIVDGTKEQILNLVAEEPRTISQLAKQLKIAPPTVHTHINEMLTSELLRDSEEWEKLHPKERYYEPNFPVVWAEDRAEFEKICAELCGQVAEVFEQARPRFEQAFRETSLEKQGWEFTDMTQYLYTCVQRGARKLLEERGTLPKAEKHRNGAEWSFWAEELEKNGK